MSSSYRRVYALGLARAFLSVDLPREARPALDKALIARAQAALNAAPPWLAGVVARLPLGRWTDLRLRELARHLEADEGLQQALATHEAPPVRHLFLGVDVQRAPTGRLAQTVATPLAQLPDVPTLAAWLGLPVDTLEWLAACGARRRTRLLAQQHYVYHLTPKRLFGEPTQRMRLIESPRLRLKAVQRRLLAGLLRRVPVHEACHGFVSGRSVLTHASTHVGQDVVLRFDLQDFFSHVGEARVRPSSRRSATPTASRCAWPPCA